MGPSLLNYYRAIRESSQLMFDAARRGDWDQLVRYESACAVLIEQLRFLSQSEQLTATDRREKASIMQSILRNDAEIRLLAEPCMGQFQAMFSAQPVSRVLH